MRGWGRMRMLLFLLALLAAGALAPGVLLGSGLTIGKTATATTFTVLTTADSGDGSLRQAIDDSNANEGTDTIEFAIDGSGTRVIAPDTPLPDITDPAVIDATTQDDFVDTPLVFLDGAPCSGCASGLTVVEAGGGSTIRGLGIGNFDEYGVLLSGGEGGSVVETSWIGIKPPTVTNSAGNQFGAVGIIDSPNNRVGGPATTQRVYTGSNANSGRAEIEISGLSSTGNLVQGSYIGLAPDGEYTYDTENGVYIGGGASGNTIGGDSADGDGNALYGFYGTGVILDGAGSGNVVAGNRIGMDDAGAVAEAPATGISVSDTDGTVIGANVGPGGLFGLDFDLGNVVVGSSGGGDFSPGIAIYGTSTGTIVAGNFVGTDRPGTATTIGNQNGIFVLGASGNQIGPGNTVAYNDFGGVLIHLGGVGNRIVANSIHDNGDKGIALAGGSNNSLAAPVITSATTTTASGTVTGPANTTFFVELFSNDSCDASLAGEGQTYLGFVSATTPAGDDPQTANWSASGLSLDEGDVLTATSTNSVTNDTSEFSVCATVVGLTVTNTDDSGAGSLRQALMNANTNPGSDTIVFDIEGSGVDTIDVLSPLPAASDVTIDGTTQTGYAPGAPRIVVHGAASDLNGLDLTGNSTIRGLVLNGFSSTGVAVTLSGSGGNVVKESFIGTNAAGDAADGNSVGIKITSDGNTVGGTGASEGNLISGNQTGIAIEDSSGNHVEGNILGLDKNGEAVVENGTAIDINSGASGNVIGGTTAAAGNLISGNFQSAVAIRDSNGNTVTANDIGIDASGDAAGNDIAVDLQNADDNVIGGAGVLGNVMADSSDAQLLIINDSSGNEVSGNFIGTDRTGTDELGSIEQGVRILNGSHHNTIGPDNTIAFNGVDLTGIAVHSGPGNRITQNAIYSNLGLGIDLNDNGVTPNDLGDGDTGPNGLQNFPELTSGAINDGGDVELAGTLNSAANTTYTLEFFASSECDPSGNGEGAVFVGSTVITTNETGDDAFTFTTSGHDFVPGDVVTATATAPVPDRNTSEFSACLVLGGGGPTTISIEASVASVMAGAERVKLEDVPGSALVQSFIAANTEAAPMSDVPMSDIARAGAPMSDIPMSDIGFPGLSAQLDRIALSSLPLLRPGGWEAALQGTPLAGLPLVTLTFGDVLALQPPPAVTLGEIDFSQSPLGRVPAFTIALGPVPLSDIGLPGGLAAWCQLFSGPPINCTSPNSLASTSLLGLAVRGAPMSDVPMSDIPMSDVPMSDVPMSDVPMSDVDVDRSPMSDVPMSDVPVGAPMSDVPMSDILLAGSPMSDIPMSDIADPNALIDCASFGQCNNPSATLGQAQTHLRQGVTVGDLRAQHVDQLAGFTIGDLNAYGDLTLADLVASLPPGNNFTLADLIVLLLPPDALSWERLDLEAADVQRFATGGSSLGLTVEFELTGGSGNVEVAVTPPDGAVYVPGSSFLSGYPGPTQLPDPSFTGGQLVYALTGLSAGTPYQIDLQVLPGLSTGPYSASAEATPTGGGTTAASPLENVDVTETFPSNGIGSPQPIDDDSFYLSHITDAGDVDYYRYPMPTARGTRTTFRLSHLAADLDLVVYKDPTPPLRPEVAGVVPLDGLPLEDRGAELTHTTDRLPPSTLDDVLLADRPIVGVSASRQLEDESVVAVSTGESGFYTIQVTGFGGASSEEPYMLRVEETPPAVAPQCQPRDFDFGGTAGTLPTNLPTGLNTVFVVNSQQLRRTYEDADTALNALTNNLPALAALGFPSAVLSVEDNAAVANAYAAWNACPADSNLANDVVRAIGAVLDGIRASRPTLRHVVLVGGDDLVPMARVDDLTTLANERGYADTFAADGALSGSLHTSRVLTDDPYGDIDPIPYLSRQLHVPDLAVGRLVETPSQIAGAIQRFVGFDGELDPQTALTTGYDFLRDGATQVHTALQALVGPANADSLISNTWTKSNLESEFLTEPTGIASINGHADHHRLQPAAGNALFTTDDVDGTTASLEGAVVFSMGCHAGLSAVDVFVTGPGEDWPQTYAAKGAEYLGNTGFGYGDTAVVAYSEELNALFAEYVEGGDLTIGQALAFAKHEYFARQGVFGVYDEKAMAELTLYGLPMYAVGGAAGGAAPAGATAKSVEQLAPDPVTGLDAEPFVSNPTFPPSSLVTVPGRGSYYTGPDGVEVAHLRPIQPKDELALTGTDTHGALVTELTSTDQANFDPVFARPTVDNEAEEPELPFGDVAFPSKIQTVTTYKTPDGTAQRLVLVVGQFFSDTTVDNDGTGVQRRFTHVAGRTFRSNSTNHVPPLFERIDSARVQETVAFAVDVGDDQPAGVKQVLVGVRDGSANEWTFVDLAQTSDPKRWTGGVPVESQEVEYFVQAVDSAGNVASSWNKGFLYSAALAPEPPTGGLETSLDGDQGENGWYTGDVDLEVTAPEGVVVEASIDGGEWANCCSLLIEGDGIHTVAVRASNGGRASLVVPIDGTAPEITVVSPADGAEYTVGQVVDADFECTDAGSGATQCDGTVDDGDPINTATTGAKTFTVNAEDAAGNTASKQVSYTVVGGGANLAPNPGFEQDPASTWLKNGPCTFRWVDDVAHGGSHSLLIDSSTSTLCRWLTGKRAIPAQPLRTFTFSAWLKTQSVRTSAKLGMTFYTAAGALLKSKAAITGTLTGTNDWTLITAQATAPAGTAYIRPEVHLRGPGNLWTDDVTLVPTSAQNRPPTCADREVTVEEGGSVELVPACTDPDSDPLTFAIVTQPSQGQASVVAGKLRYVPDQGATGADSFTYSASDGQATSPPATVDVTIMPATGGGNLAPNPGFEEDPAGTWLNNGPCTFRWRADVAHTGSHSVFISSTTTTLCRWYSDFRLITAVPGRAYRLIVWLKPTRAKAARIALIFYSANGSHLPASPASSPSVGGTGDWAPSEIQTTAPPGAAFVRAEIRLTGPGDLAADDVLLTEVG